MEMNQASNEEPKEIRGDKILTFAKEKDVAVFSIRLPRAGAKIRELKRPARFVVDYKEAKALIVNGGNHNWLVVSISRAQLEEAVKKNPVFSFLTPDFPNLA